MTESSHDIPIFWAALLSSSTILYKRVPSHLSERLARRRPTSVSIDNLGARIKDWVLQLLLISASMNPPMRFTYRKNVSTASTLALNPENRIYKPVKHIIIIAWEILVFYAIYMATRPHACAGIFHIS